MYRARAKIDFVKIPFSEQAERGKIISKKLTGHAIFIDPIISAEEIGNTANELFEAYKIWKLNGGKKERRALLDASARLIRYMRNNAYYVTSKAMGNRNLIISAGYNPTKKRKRKAKPKCTAKSTKPGCVKLHYRKAKNDKAVVWLHYKGMTPPESIQEYSIVTATVLDDITCTGFESATYECFIAAPIKSNTKAPLAFTDPIIFVIH